MTTETEQALQQIKQLNQQKDTLLQKIHALDRQIHELSSMLCPAGECLLPQER